MKGNEMSNKPTKKEFFELTLPKWPQLAILGKSVSVAQAKDIIFRTDYYLNSCSATTNNQQFDLMFRELCGTDFAHYNSAISTWIRSNDMSRIAWEVQREINKQVNPDYIDLQYVVSAFGGSCFIFGPVGFCSPEGKIWYEYNVGKWPTVKEVYEELASIAKAFPYLEFEAALYNKEHGETDPEDPHVQVVGFVVKNGKVRMTSKDLNLRKRMDLEKETDWTVFIQNGLGQGREQGLPLEWYEEWAAKVRPIANKLVGEMLNEGKKLLQEGH